ncbi:MAG: hypothetical protein ACYCV4_02520 [Dermatophilaceae bacterium]
MSDEPVGIGPEDLIDALAREQAAPSTAVTPKADEKAECPQCHKILGNGAGLASHMRSHQRGTVPPSDAKGARTSSSSPASFAEAQAWIKSNVNPALLSGAAMLGIPRQVLAQDRMLGGGLTSWPGELLPVGSIVALDDTEVMVYAAAYTYGKDTWLSEWIETYGRKALPIVLAGAVVVVTFQHVARVAALKSQLEAMMRQAQEAAMGQTMAPPDAAAA